MLRDPNRRPFSRESWLVAVVVLSPAQLLPAPGLQLLSARRQFFLSTTNVQSISPPQANGSRAGRQASVGKALVGGIGSQRA